MFEQKIIYAMQVLGNKRLPSSTRAALWQVRDKVLARHHDLQQVNVFSSGAALLGQKSSVWSGLGLFAGIALIALLATGNNLLPFSDTQQIGQIECLTCQLDKVCRL